MMPRTFSTWLAVALVASAMLPGPTANAQKPAAMAAPPLIAAEHFGALPFLSSPEISPDGRYVVSEAVKKGKPSLLVTDLQGTAPMRSLALPDDVYVNWATWAGNKVLISLALPNRALGIKFHVSRLLVYDLQNGRLRPIETKARGIDADNVIHIDDEGRFILLSAAKTIYDYPSVWRVDLQSYEAKEAVAARPGVLGWFADQDGIVRAGLGVDGRRYWLLYRENEQAKFRRILKGSIDSDDGKANIEKYIPVAGSDLGYAVADNGSGRFGIYRYDFSKDRLGAPVFEHPEVDVDDYSYTSDRKGLASIEYVDDRQRVHWLDPEFKTLQMRVDKALPNAVNTIVSSSRSRRRLIIESTAAHDPGIYYLYDVDRKIMSEFAAPYPALEGKTLARMQPTSYLARDGTKIPAYLTLPVGRPERQLPLIIMPHGGPFLRDEWSYDPWVQFLANRGYAVLQPNFRGSTGYGKKFVEAGHGQWGRKMQDDLDDGLRWLIQKGVADPKRVCIMGASYGGYAALWGPLRNPGLYRCAISFAGVSDVKAMLKYDRKLFTASRYFRDWEEQVRGTDKLDLSAISPLHAASRLSVPLLIAHGAKDDNVPVSQSQKMSQALAKAGKSHEFVVYADEGHGFSTAENSIDFLKRVEAFLRKHNPPDL